MAAKMDNAQKALMRKASRQRVVDRLAVARGEMQRFRSWLRKRNRYRAGCTKQYTEDLKTSPPSVDVNDLVAYISASSPTHVIDGWACLGRAVDATLRGDQYSAVHMAYYAELRAAMSLLAAEGVGVFDNWHAILPRAGGYLAYPRTAPKPKDRGAGTHAVVWPVLEYWSGLQRASDLLDRLVSPEAVTLTDWLGVAGRPLSTRALAKRWLSAWGVELASLDDDQSLRNLASYRPSEYRKPDALDVHETVRFVEDLWTLFEPGGDGRFPQLERHLLRRAWRRLPTTPVRPSDIERLGFSAAEAVRWASFLRDTQDPMPLALAESRSAIDGPRCHIEVISRAALLLFVASASARTLLAETQYSSSDLMFWWAEDGARRGMWLRNSVPSSLADLWADVAERIAESAAWRAGEPAGSSSLRDWRQQHLGAVDCLGCFELVGMWGLAS
jgi:hypothetical protein